MQVIFWAPIPMVGMITVLETHQQQVETMEMEYQKESPKDLQGIATMMNLRSDHLHPNVGKTLKMKRQISGEGLVCDVYL